VSLAPSLWGGIGTVGEETADMAKRRDHDRADRQAAITEVVMHEGTVRIDDLASSFDVSPMTIHRDLDTLAAQGLLSKARGSVTALATSRSEASTIFRMRRNVAEKKAVALAAIEYVEPGSTIIIDDSTTGIFLSELLPQRQPLTVITNFQPVMSELQDQAHVTLIALGGQYYPWCNAYMGSMTQVALSQLRADTFFMSTSAIIDDVCCHQHHDTVLVKQAAYEASRKRILYVDHDKFTARALHALLPLTAFDVVIVDDRTPEEHVSRLQRNGVNVVVAPVSEDDGGSAS
jgi:DeoR/GlpR family transcriptional regulator of sugar metabolism